MVKHTQTIRLLLPTNCLSALTILWGWHFKWLIKEFNSVTQFVHLFLFYITLFYFTLYSFIFAGTYVEYISIRKWIFICGL